MLGIAGLGGARQWGGSAGRSRYLTHGNTFLAGCIKRTDPPAVMQSRIPPESEGYLKPLIFMPQRPLAWRMLLGRLRGVSEKI